MHEHLHFLSTFQLLRKNVVHVSNQCHGFFALAHEITNAHDLVVHLTQHFTQKQQTTQYSCFIIEQSHVESLVETHLRLSGINLVG